MTDAERIVVTMEANIEAFERAIEERFKPALAKAISDVVFDVASGFMDGVAEEEFVRIKGEPE